MLLGVLPLVGAEGAPGTPPGKEPPVRYVVGVHELPEGRGPGDDFHGGKIIRKNDAINYLLIETRAPHQFQERARHDGNVRYVEEDVYVQFLDAGARDREGGSPPSIADEDAGVQFTPNDPLYPQQYGPQQIRADLAWDTTLGSTSAAVCILDTGVRYTHEDLTGSRWLGGFDFVNNDMDPDDDNGHGTHVAGTAAATINNAVGIAGIGNVGIYGVKVLGSGGGGTWEGVALGVIWCADNTLPNTVLSLSLGGFGGAQVLQDAVSYAYNVKNKLIVAASGNNGCVGASCVLYPAAYPEVMAVGCTTSTETRCSFSNGGPEVEIVAPGSNILSTAASDRPTFNCGGGGADYSICNGTSMSTPHVSGAAALAWSHHTVLTAAQLRERLQNTAQDLGLPGWDAEYGHGEVDAKCLLDGESPCGGIGGGGDAIWSEDFDLGLAPGWVLTGLWHVSDCRSSSSPYSLAYNRPLMCPSDFDAGATSGDAITPPISIPAEATNVRLNWESWHDTESGTFYDRKIVYITSDAGLTWTELWQEDGPQRTWNPRSVDVSGYAGSVVQFRFHFDSVDGVANAGEGWHVDDASITGEFPAGPLFGEDFDSGVAPGWTLSGLWRVTNCRSFSPVYSLGYNTGLCPPNFDVGTTSGDAITPSIPIPSGATNVDLCWMSWHDTESGTFYDRKSVYVSSDGGSIWALLWQEDGPQRTWNSRCVDVSGYAGSTVKVRFHFDSVDGVANTGEGWYVDDVSVESG